MRDVIDPVSSFNNLLKSWWKILAIAVLGGLIGLLVSFVIPPKYEAEAIFHASIDFTQINYKNMVGEYGDPLVWTQYEEDLALQAVKRVILKRTKWAFEYAQSLDPDITGEEFQDSTQIQRYLAKWYLRFRHEDPQVAQSIVNFWAEEAIEELHTAQEAGVLESFVIVDLTSLADLPSREIYHNRNILVLAGTIAGFLIGILVVDFSQRFIQRPEKDG